MRRPLLCLIPLVATLLLAACNGADPEGAEVATPTVTAEPSPPGPAPAPPAPEESPPTEGMPVEVVRAWSSALNAGDNAAAADLFALDALVIQGAGSISLPDHDSARRFNESLPCSGQIVDVSVAGDVVTAVFELGHRHTSQCDAQPGTFAAADFLIVNGKIAIWQLVPVPAEDPASPRSAV